MSGVQTEKNWIKTKKTAVYCYCFKKHLVGLPSPRIPW